jgi:Protein of unknown function (DUF664)
VTWRTPDVTRSPFPSGGEDGVLLAAWLDRMRETFLLKVSGLTSEQLKTANAEPSNLTLLGLIRHAADNERWFRRLSSGGPEGDLYVSEADPDAAFTGVADADAEADYGILLAEMDHAREAARSSNLAETVVDEDGDTMTLRVVVLHMLEEYARHTGHADLIRERIDGATGL